MIDYLKRNPITRNLAVHLIKSNILKGFPAFTDSKPIA